LAGIAPIQFSDDRSIYRQIADQIRGLIREGDLAPGERIPSEGEMVAVYECARGTVRQARTLLEREGWIVMKRGRGSFVSENPPR
jgi:GntR family transcriptional regulator